MKYSRGFVSEVLLVLAALLVARYFFDFDVIGYLSEYFGRAVEWVKDLDLINKIKK